MAKEVELTLTFTPLATRVLLVMAIMMVAAAVVVMAEVDIMGARNPMVKMQGIEYRVHGSERSTVLFFLFFFFSVNKKVGRN